MQISKGLVAFLGSLAVAGSAMAQDAAVSAEKVSPIKSLVPEVKGSIEMRYTNRRVMEGDKVVNDLNPRLDARPTLGTTLFDGDVETAFTWIFRHEGESNKITKAGLFNETFWYVLKGKNGKFGPYAYVEQGDQQDFALASLGVYGDASTSLDLGGNALELKAIWNPYADFVSNKAAKSKLAPVENRTSRSATELSLAGSEVNSEGELAIEQRDPALNNNISLGATLKPGLVKDLSIGTGVDFLQRWEPRYATTEVVEGETSAELDHYYAGALTISKVSVGYKLSDKVSITNQLRHHVNGFYEAGLNESRPDETLINVGASRWENRLILSATLF